MTFISLIPLPYVYANQYGAKGDGSTDNTSFFVNAVAALPASGGIVMLGPGVYLTGNQSLATSGPVHFWGAGKGITTIKLKNGANADLFSAYTSSINLAGANGTGSTTGANFWGFHNLTLDGNKANQTGGPSYPVRCYGYGHVFDHVDIKSGYSGGILVDWNGGANPTSPNQDFMPMWYDLTAHDCNGIAIEIGGPTDMQANGLNGFASGSHVMHVGPNSIALRLINTHLWATPTGNSSATLLCEATELQLTSCQIEGSDTCAMVVLGNDFQASGLEVGSTSDATRQGRGIQFGQQAGQTPYSGQVYQSAGVTTAATANVCKVDAKFYSCVAGAIDEKNTSGNKYDLVSYQTSGTAIASNSGYPVGSSSGSLIVEGLTPDGSPGKGGFFQIGNGSFYGMQVYDKDGGVLFSLDTYDKVFQLKNGRAFSGYSDNGSTLKYNLDASTGDVQLQGNLSTGQSASAAAVASSGTITTANIGEARVAPTANVNGIILAAGSTAGQEINVVNESAFSIQFAASGTSHVALGVTDIIQANSKRTYTWDSSTSLWYGEPLVGQQSASAAATASSGTITTAGVDQARVAPTGNITGVVLQAGTYANQQCTVVNESAFTVTFNTTPATSNVAGSAADPAIPAKCCRLFKWDSATSFWYRAA